MHYRIALLTSVLLAVIGCGPNHPPTAPVTGKITFEGQPVTAGTITFYPQEGRSSLAKIQPDGSYTLTTFETNDGALLGDHKVTIKATQVTNNAMPESFEAEVAQGSAPTPTAPAVSTITWLVPETYANRATSPLTAVVEDKPNEINFDLPQ